MYHDTFFERKPGQSNFHKLSHRWNKFNSVTTMQQQHRQQPTRQSTNRSLEPDQTGGKYILFLTSYETQAKG